MNEIVKIREISKKKVRSLKKFKPLLSNNVIAMVPVRAGSTRIPNKNTRPLVI